MKTALRVLPVAAFRCEPLARSMTRDECADTARRAHVAPGPKIERPCTTCPIGEAHLRGEHVPDAAVPRKRSTAPRMMRIGDELVSLSEAARRTGLDRATLRYREANGIPLDAPSRQSRSKAQAVAPRTAPPLPPAMLIVVLRAMGYAAEASTVDGEEVLVVRGPV